MNAGVEIFQFVEGGFSAGDFSNVFGAAVEVPANFFGGDLAIVEDGDLFGSCKDEILGDFYSKLYDMVGTPEMP